MIIALGLKHDGKQIIFEPEKLRYHKFIMMTDADVDGRVDCQ